MKIVCVMMFLKVADTVSTGQVSDGLSRNLKIAAGYDLTDFEYQILGDVQTFNVPITEN